jgi:hypothetical protein
MRRRRLIVAAGQPKTERDNHHALTADVRPHGRRDILHHRLTKSTL